MDYIATEAEKASVRGNGSIKSWTFSKSLIGKWKSGKAGIDEAVAVCGEIKPCVEL